MTATSAGPVSLTRVVLFVSDDTEIDYVLPSGAALIAVIEDLIPRVNIRLRQKGREVLSAEGGYQLCRADARPLDPEKSLDEAGVVDGDALWLLPLEATEQFEPVIEYVSTAIARHAQAQFERVDATVARRVAVGLGAGLTAWAELILTRLWWQSGGWVPAATSWSIAAALVIAAWMAGKAVEPARQAVADPLAWMAMIPLAAASALSVPGAPSGWHAVVAVSAALGWTVLLVMLTDRHLAAASTLLTVGMFGAVTLAVASSGWQVPAERVAVVALLVVLGLVTFATNIGVIGSGVPGPWFPSVTGAGVFENLPGTPADTVSPVFGDGAGSPEQIAKWTRRGNAIVTGALLGCGLVAVVAARCAVVPGQPRSWRYLVFAVAICVVFLLRGRSFVDRWQSVALAVSAVAGIAAIIGRYAAASSPPSLSMSLVCVGLTCAMAVAGLVAVLVVADARVSAPIRRAVELVEYVLLIFVVPWAVWLLGLVSVMRNLVG
ncbi:type VII secretion integral membrane protein EccD [Mycolicibacter arupensis]|jgi:type VII secretion integral membrane protein EccD|uniref:Type VII secretion integral membrane protein EccD n=1 Tax=Mycolicibacter arupensis TaxID=342002 RepID=A0A5C7Y8L6_9MYCO|nr:type VII secretion integral membrane protein EccD [Mycolicibacter arupensis]TXI57986.1 MAG: type VII secretion integral membrane protein EccD [Mycolicibacter arupensis]